MMSILILQSCDFWETLTSNKNLLYGDWEISAAYSDGEALPSVGPLIINSTFFKSNTVTLYLKNNNDWRPEVGITVDQSFPCKYDYSEKNSIINFTLTMLDNSEISTKTTVNILTKNALSITIDSISSDDHDVSIISSLLKDVTIEFTKI